MKEACIICGFESKQLENEMCDLCNHLSKEKFYEIKSVFEMRAYYKNYLGKDPVTYKFKDENNKEISAKEYIDEMFKKFPTDKYIYGIMPSRCPFCLNLATNRQMIQTIKRDSEEYQRIVINGELPKLICKACGDLSLYLKHAYSFSNQKAVEILKNINQLVKEIKEKKLALCEKCSNNYVEKEKYTEEDRKKALKINKKYLCEDCMKEIK